MRTKKLKYTIMSSIIYQIIAIVCGFIMPRIILKMYNSEVNGLVNSITSFLNIITFLDLGVGTVVCSSLYKPLAEKDDVQVSKIYKSASKYFKNIGKVLIVYMFIIPFFFIFKPNYEFDYIYTVTLVVSMGLSLFSQYYFGIVNRLLITADQKEYIQYVLQSITLILTTLICSILMLNEVSIQTVKLVTSLIFLIRPIFLSLYVKKNYNLNYNIKYDKEPIAQKWNGIYQHIAAVILDSTDIAVLTVFSSLANVSIYSVYYLVIHGIRQTIQSVSTGFQSFFGNIIASKEDKKLGEAFEMSEFAIHFLSVFSFGCTLVLITPFIQVYTKGVTDANYTQSLFGILLALAHLMYCLRIPYHLLVKAKGHYKQTQKNYIVATGLNIIISILFVKSFGLVGVAIGTFVAMLYQTIWMTKYCYQNILEYKIKKFVKLIIFDSIFIFISICLSFYAKLSSLTYFNFGILTLKYGLINVIIIIILSFLLYKKLILKIIKRVLGR